MNVYEKLNELSINYDEITHDEVYTVEDAKYLENKINGVGCKCLFLTDRKGNYFLYVLKEDKRADLKLLASFLKTSRLSFAKDDELYHLLGLTRGSVSPLGIINDINYKVKIILDKDLVNNKLLVHPNTNTKTISIYYKDLIKYIDNLGHDYFIV